MNYTLAEHVKSWEISKRSELRI